MKSIKPSRKELKKIIEEENNIWSEIFDKEIKNRKRKKQKFSSFWWQEYYSEMTDYILNKISNKKNPKILEMGCGSGKASLLLGKDKEITLLDISSSALKYSKLLANDYSCKKVKFFRRNIFDSKIRKLKFDLVWNIGVLEHYTEEKIILILKEMIRVTKKGGIISFGIPNFFSGPIIKALILTKLPLNFLSGYRLNTEKFYSSEKLINLLEKSFFQLGEEWSCLEVNYFGNIFPMETPTKILKTFGKLASIIFIKNKFLIMVTVTKK